MKRTMRYFVKIKHHMSVSMVLAILLAGLTACADINGEHDTHETQHAVIIEISAESTAFEKAIRPLLDDKANASLRLYNNVRAVAVTLDGETLLKVLQLPDVISVRPDREIGPAIKDFSDSEIIQSQPPKSN